MINDSSKLIDALYSSKLIRKYLKAIKDEKYKAATAIAKLFPYSLIKPTKTDDPASIKGLIIERFCHYDCENCRNKRVKEKGIQQVQEETEDMDKDPNNVSI